jgi:hypothetical protein
MAAMSPPRMSRHHGRDGSRAVAVYRDATVEDQGRAGCGALQHEQYDQPWRFHLLVVVRAGAVFLESHGTGPHPTAQLSTREAEACLSDAGGHRSGAQRHAIRAARHHYGLTRSCEIVAAVRTLPLDHARRRLPRLSVDSPCVRVIGHRITNSHRPTTAAPYMGAPRRSKAEVHFASSVILAPPSPEAGDLLGRGSDRVLRHRRRLRWQPPNEQTCLRARGRVLGRR